MRTTPALITLALAATLTACGQDDGTVTVSPPPATVTVTEEPILTDLPPPEPRLLTLDEVCEEYSDFSHLVDVEYSDSLLNHVDRIDELIANADSSVRQTFVPVRDAYFDVFATQHTTTKWSRALGRTIMVEDRVLKACYGVSNFDK
ncbi:hypothetical protein ENKNEFLB_02106 [Nocardioides aquaticus]|uniref:Uncharacterized protein n=1 Tax=Nocardioides aquaticus TaxID=160826 RepID=A0ABX8EGS0_9ACTN|nr:hypothetical protein [Nocardioides aquaticus]QVT79716.1 hypothetical protein ENKNEFLB_02106 [Nocardioides aquaticus]